MYALLSSTLLIALTLSVELAAIFGVHWLTAFLTLLSSLLTMMFPQSMACVTLLLIVLTGFAER